MTKSEEIEDEVDVPFVQGDVVVLNSGSVPMTVVECFEDGAADLVFFNYNSGELIELTISTPLLRKFEMPVPVIHEGVTF